MSENFLEKIKNGEIEYQEANEGVVNSTYITEDHVVQEPDHGDGRRLKKNRLICNKLHDSGAPVPEVVEYSEEPLFMVFEKLEGILLENRNEFSDNEYLEAVRNAGKALAKIHGQEVSKYGKPDREQGFKSASHDSWTEFVQESVEGTMGYVKDERFRPIVEKASKIIDVNEMPDDPENRLLHMDYTPDNIIIDSDLEAHVIDFDNAYHGDPLFDLMYTELGMQKRGEEVAETLMEGYKDVRDPGLTDELERNYRAMAVMQDARAGEWCLRNEKDVNFEEWSKGLQKTVDRLE